MPNYNSESMQIARDIIVAALNNGFPKWIIPKKSNFSTDYIEQLKDLITTVYKTVDSQGADKK